MHDPETSFKEFDADDASTAQERAGYLEGLVLHLVLGNNSPSTHQRRIEADGSTVYSYTRTVEVPNFRLERIQADYNVNCEVLDNPATNTRTVTATVSWKETL